MFALIDCNNFYASCEQVFNPKLKGKPLVVLSNNDGCVIARSKEAKSMGIPMGAPAFQYKRQIAGGQLLAFSSNFTLYGDLSNRVMMTLETFGFDMEIYSIDEAFLDLFDGPEEDLLSIGWQIREKIDQWVGLPISVGVAPTKTLAKIANHIAKREKGVHILTGPKRIQDRLDSLDVEEVWGIGRRLAKRLRKKGVFSAGQLTSREDSWIQKEFSITTLRTAMELRGTSCYPCDEAPSPKKSILCSRSFRRPIEDLADLTQAVADFTTIAAEKLRGQNSLAPRISVFIATSPFSENYYSNSCNLSLSTPSSYTPELISQAKRALIAIYREGKAYKRAGVYFSDLLDGNALQMDFWDKGKNFEKNKRLMEAIDKINFRYDKRAVHSAALGLSPKWKYARTHTSPQFTTDWDQLLRVR